MFHSKWSWVAGALALIGLALIGCDGKAPSTHGHSQEYLVVIGGFGCPAALPERFDMGDFSVCMAHGSDPSDLPREVCADLNDCKITNQPPTQPGGETVGSGAGGSGGMSTAETVGSGAGPGTSGACTRDTPVCTADYPCQDLLFSSTGYTCRGQFADWRPTDSPSTFTENGNGVMDSNTGLLWQQGVRANTYTLQDAEAYCQGLSGQDTDWRLPTKAELESILDFGSSAIIDPIAFPGTPNDIFWTSSPFVSDTSKWWVVSFAGSGAVLTTATPVAITYTAPDAAITGTEAFVRCVQSGGAGVTASAGSGGAPPGRYTVDVRRGTVYDTLTQLTWQQTVPAAPTGCSGGNPDHQEGYCTVDQAIAYCEALSLAGGGWRLPKVSELLTIVDPTTSNPAIDATAFPNTPSSAFCSATPSPGLPGALVVRFSIGEADVSGRSNEEGRVRCVR